MRTDRDPHKLLVTCDLHFGLYPDGDRCTERLAAFVCASGADAFAIAGDVADIDTERFGACLELFRDFPGLKLLVPGNHDLWSVGVGSLEKYRRILPAIASDRGFRTLDVGPVTAGRTGFIGNIGWYDYTFRSDELKLSLDQYRLKKLPGVCTWNDLRYIDWDMTDEEFTAKCLRKLRAAYRSIEPTVHTVVAVVHHVAFRELLYGKSGAAHEFSRAYLGSERIGELLLKCPKVRYVFCGHRHGPDSCTIGQIEAFSVGSDYQAKRLIEMDLRTGERQTHVFSSEAAGKEE